MASCSEEHIVCRCFVVPEGVIRKAIADRDLHHVEEVTACTKAGGGCSSCWDDIQQILCEMRGTPAARDAADGSGLSSAQKRALIVKVIEREAQTLFDRNDLQMQLVDVTGDRVLVRFFGSAVGTPAPSFLAIKRFLVLRMSEACGRKMNLIELNVLEGLSRVPQP